MTDKPEPGFVTDTRVPELEIFEVRSWDGKRQLWLGLASNAREALRHFSNLGPVREAVSVQPLAVRLLPELLALPELPPDPRVDEVE